VHGKTRRNSRFAGAASVRKFLREHHARTAPIVGQALETFDPKVWCVVFPGVEGGL
jgi:hypothetical protein